MIVRHEGDYNSYPFFLYVVVIAGKLPRRFIFVLLGLEGVVLVGQGLPDVFPLHEIPVVKIYLK
jgi:hypothetical protein